MGYIDLTGQRFGKQVALEKVGSSKDGRATWLCRCDCGQEITTTSANLIRGHTKSCGCFRKERVTEAHQTHGDGSHINRNRLYHIWADIKNRCNSPNCRAYKNYGGRGIHVCEEWQNYSAFKQWAFQNGYNEELTIDRIDVNKDYSPSNCRWVSKHEQCQNKRNSRKISYNGETKTLSQWAIELRIPRTTFAHRLDDGWNIEEAMKKRDDNAVDRESENVV